MPLLLDFKFAARLLRRDPGLTAVAVATLALGIAANTIIFTAIDAFVLRPLPLPEPDQLVFIHPVTTKTGASMPSTWPDFQEWKQAGAQVFQSIAALQIDSFNVALGAQAHTVRGSRVKADFFAVMGLPPQLGRTLSEEDDQPGAAPAVVLNHRFWITELGGDPDVIGHKLVIDGAPHTIAGVMSEALTFPGDFCDFWVPLQATPARYKRGDHVLAVVARLRDAGLLDEARSRLTAANERLQSTFPEFNKDLGVLVTPLQEQMTRGPKRALMVLFAAVAFVLLISCANISNLLLARAVHRRREIAIRVALGAGRWPLLRQMLIESLLLAFLGGTLGTLVAVWGVQLLSNAIPAGLRPADGLSLNAHVLAFTAALSIFTCLLFGLAPVVRILRHAGPDVLHIAGRNEGGTRSHSRTASLLVAGEIAIAALLLTGSALLVDALRRQQSGNLGFDSKHVLTAEIIAKAARYEDPAQASLLVNQLLARLRATPGVQAAAAVNWPPMTNDSSVPFRIEGATPDGTALPAAGYRVATPDYARAMNITVTHGRFLSVNDTRASDPVLVVNERFAHLHWPGRDPLGLRIALADGGGKFGTYATVVGVISDVRHQGPANDPEPELYFPFDQRPQNSFYLAIRTTGNPSAFGHSLEQLIHAADANLPLNLVRPMDRVIADRIAPARIATALLTIFSTVALLLAAMGLYGVISYLVARRTHEFGIRLALGACTRDLLMLVLRRAFVLTATGTTLGVLGGMAVSRVLSFAFEGVRPSPGVCVITAVTLAGIALLATWAPLRRALSVGPMIALRSE